MNDGISGKAYEMNAYAVAKNYSASRRGSPEGFTRIEAKLAKGEKVLLAFTAKNIKIKDNMFPSGKISSEAACALTTGFLYIASGEARTVKYPLYSFRSGIAAREYRSASLKTNSLLYKATVTVKFGSGTVSFEVNPSTADEFCDELKNAFSYALAEVGAII